MTRARFTKTHFQTIANCISLAQQAAGRDVNTPYLNMQDGTKAIAFDYLMERLVDAFNLDNDLFDARKFREAANID